MKDSRHNGSDNSIELGHEESRVQVAAITWFIIILTISCVFVGWLMIALFNSFEGREQKSEQESRPSPFAAERPKLPPEPRLQLAPNSEEQIDKRERPNLKQQSPLQEMKDLRTNWDKQLNTYGWVDEQNGIVRIPIEDAKRLLIQRGLPTRQQKKPAESTEVSPKSDQRTAAGQH
jgi:hypothetical protein